MSQVGYGVTDVIGSPFDYYTDAAQGGITGKLVTGSTIQARNLAVVVYKATSALAALTVTLPQNAPEGAVFEFSNAVGSQTITSLTINAATSYPLGSNQNQQTIVSDTVVGTAVSATSTAAAVTYRFKYSLAGDATNGAGPRSWIRVL